MKQNQGKGGGGEGLAVHFEMIQIFNMHRGE